jgi:hypothetical protein
MELLGPQRVASSLGSVLLGGVCVAGATCLPCHADFIEFTHGTGTQIGTTASMPFEQFNPALGVLTGITFSQIDPLSANADFRNRRPTAVTIDANAYGWLEFRLPGIAATGSDPLGIHERNFSLTGSLWLPAGGEGNMNLGSETLHPFERSPNPAAFINYIGIGYVQADYKNVLGFSYTPDSPLIDWRLNFQWSAVGTLRYTYTPIPEPASGSLMLLVGLPVIMGARYLTKTGGGKPLRPSH